MSLKTREWEAIVVRRLVGYVVRQRTSIRCEAAYSTRRRGPIAWWSRCRGDLGREALQWGLRRRSAHGGHEGAVVLKVRVRVLWVERMMLRPTVGMIIVVHLNRTSIVA